MFTTTNLDEIVITYTQFKLSDKMKKIIFFLLLSFLMPLFNISCSYAKEVKFFGTVSKVFFKSVDGNPQLYFVIKSDKKMNGKNLNTFLIDADGDAKWIVAIIGSHFLKEGYARDYPYWFVYNTETKSISSIWFES